MFRTIGYCLRNLTRFSGRDPRSVFWPYAAFVFVLMMLGSYLAIIPTFFAAFSRVQSFAASHPDQAVVTTGAGSYSVEIRGEHPEFIPDIWPFFVGMAVVMIVVILLLAAAVARRLHDRNRSALWGLLPVPFLALGLAISPILFTSFTRAAGPNLALLPVLVLNNFAYVGALIALIVMLASAGTPGPNRFGFPAGQGSTDPLGT